MKGVEYLVFQLIDMTTDIEYGFPAITVVGSQKKAITKYNVH